MAKITFYGATQEVTGSMHLVTDTNAKFLVDCGLHQGEHFADERNHEEFPFNPTEIDAVFLTHAHMDHIGRLPKLVKDGYHGPVYTTSATRDLAEILYEDAVEIMQEEAERRGTKPIYEPEDVPRVLERFVTVEYHEAIPLPDGWHAQIWDAGHILGSGIVDISKDETHLIFSGDLGNATVPILRPTESPTEATFVTMESTYGNQTHEGEEERGSMLKDAIVSTMKKGGTLMIPSFALERTQELLYYINELRTKKEIPDVPVFLDSPLAIHATNIFERHMEVWNTKDRDAFRRDNFFDFDGLKMTATRDESRAINGVTGPKIIIAGSGMMNGGRILHHAKRYLGDANSMLLFIGYQANGTLGRALLSGNKHVNIHGEKVFVRASIKAIGAFSAHADEPHLLAWLKGMKKQPEQVALVHGEPDRMEDLEAAIERQLHLTVIMPKQGDSVTV